MLEKFAEELKAEREAKGISLIMVATKTRLDIKFLKEMEKGNFSFLPELYVKAFIKDYAKVLDLDETILLKKYEAAKKGKAYDEKGETEEEVQLKKTKQENDTTSKPETKATAKPAYSAIENDEKDESQKSKQTPKTIVWIAAAAVIVLAVIYFVFIRSSSDIIVSEKPYDQVKQSSKERFIPETPEATADSSVQIGAVSDSLSLEIDATDTSWVKLLIDGSLHEEFTLFPHSTKNIRAAKNFQIIVGNAAVTHFSLNKKPLEFSGKNKEVRYISIDSTGLKYLSAPPNFSN